MAKKKLTEDELKWILSVDSTEAQQSVRKLDKENKQLASTNKDLKAKMVELVAAGKKESEEYKNLSAEVEKNNTKLILNKKKITELEKTLGLTSLTMAQLRKKAKELRYQLDHTSQVTHPEEWSRLNKNLLGVRSRMDELKVSGKKTGETLSDTITSSGKIATFLGNMYTKAAEWAMEALSKAKEFITEGVKMGGMAQGVERAFNRISTRGLMDELRRSTKGMVNDLQLMQSAVQANNFKIPLEELGILLRFAQQRAQETGESVDYLTDSIVTGIGRQSPLILDNLGISASKLREEVAKTGDFAKAVGKIVREELAKSGESIDTAADKAQQRAVLLQNIQMSIGQRMIGIVNSVGSAWTSFLDVINRWVSIPTVEKLRDEQRETNVLARSIMAAEGRTEARNLLIQEMQRQYPSFLANLDTEKLTNEQLAERLRDVNGEYENRLRAQVMNDKILSPLQRKQRELIEEEMNGITNLNNIVDLYGKSMSSSFREAIRNGDVLKMSTKDIDKQLSIMRKNGAAGGLTVGLEKTINQLKELPSELKEVELQIQMTTERIASFGKSKQSQNDLLQPLSQQVSLIEHISSLRKQAAEEMKENTEEEIKAKNQVLKKYDDEIARLRSLGIENDTEKKSSFELKLKEQENAHQAELTLLKNTQIQSEQTEQFYNLQRLSADTKFYQERLKLLQDYQKKSSDPKLQADISKDINAAQASLIDTQQKRDQEMLSVLKDNRDKRLKLESQSYKTQQIVFEKELAEKQITQQQYDALMLSLDTTSSESRLKIYQDYQSDIISLELSSGIIKAQAVSTANEEVMTADLAAAQARAAQQKTLQNLVKDFKAEFKLTTVGEDTDLQLKVLEASYNARKEMAQKANMDTFELDQAFERARTNILQEAENRRNQIRQQNGLLSMQELHQIELDLLEDQREAGLLDEEEYQQAILNKRIAHLKTYYDYYNQLFSGAISALQEAELANIDAKYDAEIQRAGENSEEVARLEKEKENKKLAVQKKYANVNFAIKVSEIIANTAVSITQAFAQLGPIAGAIAAAMLTATGAAQIATANAERKKVMAMTVDGAGGTGSGTGARVATGRESGGYVDVVRAQDGKKFDALMDPHKRGFIDRPTVIVGEGPAGRSKEWVASNDALQNPTVLPFIEVLNDAQEKGVIRTVDMNQLMRKRLAGFENGGFLNKPTTTPVLPNTVQNKTINVDSADIRRLNELLDKLGREGIQSWLIYSEFEKEQKRLEESRKIGSK